MKNETTIDQFDRCSGIAFCFYTEPAEGGKLRRSARILVLAKGTVHGLVWTLSRAGLSTAGSESRKYRSGLKIYELGMILAGTLDINENLWVLTSQLAERTGLTAKIAIGDGNSALLWCFRSILEPIPSSRSRSARAFPDIAPPSERQFSHK